MHEIKTYEALLPAKSGYKPGETMDSLTGRTWEGLIGNPISIQTSGLIQPEKPICFSLRPGVGKAEAEDGTVVLLLPNCFAQAAIWQAVQIVSYKKKTQVCRLA